MADFNEENKIEGVFGGVDYNNANTNTETQGSATAGYSNAQGAGATDGTVFTKVDAGSLPAKPSVWTKIRSFLFQEIDWTAPIKVELTPYQQKVEDEINEFLHQEISFKGFFNLISGKK